MEDLGIGQNELARTKSLSKGAISHVLKWLELSKGARALIEELRIPRDIRIVSRRFRKELLLLQPAAQIKAIKARIKSAK